MIQGIHLVVDQFLMAQSTVFLLLKKDLCGTKISTTSYVFIRYNEERISYCSLNNVNMLYKLNIQLYYFYNDARSQNRINRE